MRCSPHPASMSASMKALVTASSTASEEMGWLTSPSQKMYIVFQSCPWKSGAGLPSMTVVSPVLLTSTSYLPTTWQVTTTWKNSQKMASSSGTLCRPMTWCAASSKQTAQLQYMSATCTKFIPTGCSGCVLINHVTVTVSPPTLRL